MQAFLTEQMVKGALNGSQNYHRTILGVSFFGGSATEAIARIKHGGLVVVPAAPALKDLDHDIGYREALLHSDLVIADSSLMVLVWNVIESDSLRRLSGLEYLRRLLLEPDVRKSGNTVWVMASEKSAATNVRWLADNGIVVDRRHIYVAPMYTGETVEDPELTALIRLLQPRHVIITLGGGIQERLGYSLKRNLEYLPSIHCIGAAIAFLSGDQVLIPALVDRFYLGWVMRCFSEPRRYIPRYWEARKLIRLMLKYRSELPLLRSG